MIMGYAPLPRRCSDIHTARLGTSVMACRSALSASVPASRSELSNGNGLEGSIPGFTPGNIATALRLLLPKLARALKPIGTGSWLKYRKERSTSAGTTAKREPTSGPNAREKETLDSEPQ